MSRKHSWNNVAAAFTTVAKKVERGEPIVISKIGLPTCSASAFKMAVTHSFKKEKHGFDLQRIFIIDDKGLWHRNTSPNTNPKDEHLIDLIIKAMTYVRREKITVGNKSSREFSTSQVNLHSFKVEDLLKELITRGYIVNLIAK